MPDKDGDDDKKSTKSVVNKKQKQMLNQEDYLPEEGYDVARDQGRVRPSKDKKDATTMPVSKEMRKTQKVNKGPSALDVVKKKYKDQIMDELDLSKVAESFGGYIVEAPVDSQGNIIPKPGEADKTEKLIKKTRNVQTSGTQKPKRGAKKMSGQRNIITGKPEFKTAKTTYNVKKKLTPKNKPEVEGQLSLDLNKPSKPKPTPAMSGGKVKGTPKGPTLKSTTSGRKIEKKFSSKQPSTTTQKALPVYKAGGPYVPDKTTFTGTGKSAPKMEPKPKGMTPTVPVKPSRTPIPKDTGSLKDAPKVKKQFGDFRKKLDALKTDIKVDKDIEKNIARVDRGKKISKGADFSGVSRKTGAMKSGPKVVKQLGRAPKLGGSVVKVVGKETKKAAAKTAAKAVTKTAAKKALQKGVAKSAAKAIPGLGSVIAGVEAGARAVKGDFAGAALSAGEAIPGVGLGFAGANIARDVSRAKKAASAVKNVTKAKRAKDAVKVVTPTVVGTRADKIAQQRKGISNFAKTPAGKLAGVTGGVLTTSNLRKVKPNSFKPPAVKGGKVGRRSAGR